MIEDDKGCSFTVDVMASAEQKPSGPRVLLLEAFYGGSHKQLVDLLHTQVPSSVLHMLPAKKWHWRARTSALYFAEHVPHNTGYRVLFASAVLNLAELVALRPDLATLKKVLYFHENQLVYPVRKQQDRDFQYGYNQILSCLVADVVVFNSQYNLDSFLSSINTFLKLIPDHRPKGLADKIKPKCSVLHFPIQFPTKDIKPDKEERNTTYGSAEQESRLTTDQEEMDVERNSPMCSQCEHGRIPVEQDQHREAKQNQDRIELECEKQCHDRSQVESGPQCNVCDVDDRQDTNSNNKRSSNFIEQELPVTLIEPEKKPKIKAQLLSEKAELSDVGFSSETEHLSISVDIGNACGGDTCNTSDRRVSDVTITSSEGKPGDRNMDRPLHILWPHRWEHDKDPGTFFQALYMLQAENLPFHVSVLGESFTDVPDVFEEAHCKLQDHILHWSYLPSKQDYYNVLRSADLVISTAKHEFFGVAMLEAVHLGCYPLCPNNLVYPEIFPKEYLYNTPNQLTKRLKQFARRPQTARNKPIQVNTDKYSWSALEESFLSLLQPG